MSGSGAPTELPASKGMRVAVVASSWHDEVMQGLVAGALAALHSAGAQHELFRVPGSFELPLAAQRAANAGFDAVVALGVVIRGGTPHFEYVCTGVTQGLTQAALATGVPIGFGVLTCDSEADALDRAGLPGSSEDKGGEAVAAALGAVTALQRIDEQRRSYAGFTAG